MASDTIKSYQVTAGPLAKNQTYTGLILRDETVYTASSGGYATYYARDGKKIKSGGAVYAMSANKQDGYGIAELSEEAEAAASEEVRTFLGSFSPTSFGSAYDLKYTLSADTLLAESPEDGVTANDAGIVCRTDEDGIVSFYTDGYEDFSLDSLSANCIDSGSAKKVSLKTDEYINAGQAMFKLASSEKWSVIVPLTAKQIVKLSARTSIRVKFLKDGVTQTASFSIIAADDGSYFGKLDFTSGMLRYINDRFISVELVTNSTIGLKIPVTAVDSAEFYVFPSDFLIRGGDSNSLGVMAAESEDGIKETYTFKALTLYGTEDGNAYAALSSFSAGEAIVVSDDDGRVKERYTIGETVTLEGVYNMNKGYPVFRRVEILDKNEEYCLVKGGLTYSISQYDYIALKASAVTDTVTHPEE